MLGAVCGAIATLLGSAVLILQLVGAWKKLTEFPNSASVHATRGELDAQTMALTTALGKFDSDLKAEIKRVEGQLTGESRRLEAEVKEVQAYTRERIHTLVGEMQTLVNRMEIGKAESYRAMRDHVDAAVKPLGEKLDSITVQLVRMEKRHADNESSSYDPFVGKRQ